MLDPVFGPARTPRSEQGALPGVALAVALGAGFGLGACKEQALWSTGDAGQQSNVEASVDASSGVPTTRPGPPSRPTDGGADPNCSEEHALDLYHQKIEPLFEDDRPSTCSQCHLPGIDLGMFVRGTPCETLACLVDERLVNPGSPADSKILTWIGRAEPDSELITEEVIQREHDAFEQWISYSIQCGTCEGSVCPETDEGPKCALGSNPDYDFEPESIDPGGCGDEALETVFRETVYANRGRCSPCHFNDHDDEEAPQWIEVSFECDEASRRTLDNVAKLGLIDFEQPGQSLLLLKPLAEDEGGVTHGGGAKFEGLEDKTYSQFKYFVDRFVACRAP